MKKRKVAGEPAEKRFATFGLCELTQIDPDRNRRRYYCISLQAGLFDLILQRQWGRLGCRPQFKDEFFTDIQDGIKQANRLYRQKVRKGYREF